VFFFKPLKMYYLLFIALFALFLYRGTSSSSEPTKPLPPQPAPLPQPLDEEGQRRLRAMAYARRMGVAPDDLTNLQ
jgi:hypothetical protein